MIDPLTTTGTARWRLSTPAGVAGALAVIQVEGDVDDALRKAGFPPVRMGELRLADLAGIDRGVVVRWRDDLAHVMPHGGVAVVRAVCEALRRAGVRLADGCGAGPGPGDFPEAGSRLEARMLSALASSTSPLAIDLILDQPRRWAEAGLDPDADPATLPFDAALERARSRLIDPPLVVAIGPPNVGKSTLVNRLAGRGVSIVADEPGTTRDHVGALLDLAGLVVRWVDSPGIRGDAGPEEREAAALAKAVADRADLLVVCGDPRTPPPEAPTGLRVCLRRDLGLPAWSADAEVSARTGDGVEALVARLRDRLVPAAVLADPSPWSLRAGMPGSGVRRVKATIRPYG